MAYPVIVGIVGAAAEVFAKELAVNVGGGIVETLFNQKKIAADLEDIKRLLVELSEFVRIRLPKLVEHAVDLALAKNTEFLIVETANAINGSVIALEEAIANKQSQRVLLHLEGEVARHSDAVFILGGTLLSYGQAYYASAGIAFGAGLRGYAAMMKVLPDERFKSLKGKADVWKARLQPWVDAKKENSFLYARNWWEARYELAKVVAPKFLTRLTGTTREVAISWRRYPENNQIFVTGAWFGWWEDRGLDGKPLGVWLPPGTSFEEAKKSGSLRFNIPEWWEVKPDAQASWANYHECAGELSNLIRDYYAFEGNFARLSAAVNIVDEVLKATAKLLERPEGAWDLHSTISISEPNVASDMELDSRVAGREEFGISEIGMPISGH